MFTTNDYAQLESLMDECPENRALIEKLLNAHQFTVSKISHEVRNPLTLVSSTLQLIESQHPEVADFAHWSQLLEDVAFMTQLLNELSHFNNGQKIAKVPFDFRLFMEHIALSFATIFTDSPIEFISKVDPALPFFTGDKTKLKEVFLNLLQNAKDAIPAQGTIFLNAHLANHGIEISIQDTGCGISSEHLTSVFTPFVTHKPSGTGLGLPLAQKIIVSHHGQLEISSTPGVGTTITIFLPIQ